MAVQRTTTPDLDEKEINELFNSLDTDGDGSLSPQEILVGFRRLGLPSSKRHVQALMDEVCTNLYMYTVFDIEFTFHLYLTITNIFKKADTNRDGSISRSEFTKFAKQRESELRRYRCDHKRFVYLVYGKKKTKNYCNGLHDSISSLTITNNRVFDEIDRDHNGTIDLIVCLHCDFIFLKLLMN